MAEPRSLELLAPARNCDIARQAIIHGADAVYIGAESFGARAAATNTIDDIASLTEFAHRFNVRVYVTFNTLIYDHELDDARTQIHNLYRAGVDALIVQDPAVLNMDLPPIALHASTQFDTRDVEKARFLEDCGFSQIVLARELSLTEIKEITSSVSVPVEVFVHGALCVSYSGDCQASLLATGRSANRGECAQMCRLSYTLADAHGNKIGNEAHYLSLRDMNRLDRLADLADAGVSSFKIEGRLKDADYVKNVVAAYSRALDRLVTTYPDRYKRQSCGRTEYKFTPDLKSIFNRNFTSYFLDGRPGNGTNMASVDTPKWIGQAVAKVIVTKGKTIQVKAFSPLNNGDGLGYFDKEGKFCGFRVNRAEGNQIYPASLVNLPAGTTLYRNRDKSRDDLMAKDTATRTVDVNACLRTVGKYRIALKITDKQGIYVELTTDCQLQKARSSQSDARYRAISKLGDTIYRIEKFDDLIADDCFIPVSILTDLRRKTIELFDKTRLTRYSFDYRSQPNDRIRLFKGGILDRHDNVANRLSEEFYKSKGFTITEKAAEISLRDENKDFTVMTTRYCLRRELGACLRTPSGNKLPSPLFLKSPGIGYRLDFDCSACRMHVVVPGKICKC